MQRQLKTLLPPRLKRPLRRLYAKTRYHGHQHYCPACGSFISAFLSAGIVPRPNARCPVCGSLERHRLMAIFFRQWTDLFSGRPYRFLHIAPETIIQEYVMRAPNLTYISADLSSRDVALCMDLTAIACSSQTLDIVYCSHVLEHVLDDRQAMRELARILKPTGWAALQVPITVAATVEDPTITDPRERLQVFGQADHVRRYGWDFTRRLAEAGLLVLEIPAAMVVGAANMNVVGLNPSEHVFFCATESNAAFTLVQSRMTA